MTTRPETEKSGNLLAIRRMHPWANAVGRVLASLLPVLTVIVAAVLRMVPLVMGDVQVLVPPFWLPVVFYWLLRAPRLLPAWLLFAVGLWLDAVFGTPLGTNALFLVVLSRTTAKVLSTTKNWSFVLEWLGFLLAAAALVATHGGVAWVFSDSPTPWSWLWGPAWKILIVGVVINALTYPLAFILLEPANRFCAARVKRARR